MAMICKKCKGIIPDVVFGGDDRNDCACHTKPEINVELPSPVWGTSCFTKASLN